MPLNFYNYKAAPCQLQHHTNIFQSKDKHTFQATYTIPQANSHVFTNGRFIHTTKNLNTNQFKNIRMIHEAWPKAEGNVAET